MYRLLLVAIIVILLAHGGEEILLNYIEITKFGPVDYAKMDLTKDIQVVIGSQASGKSTVFRMVYFCQKIRDYIQEYLMMEDRLEGTHPDNIFPNCMKYLTEKFMDCFGKTLHMQNFKVYYQIDDERSMTIMLNERHYIRYYFSPIIKKEITELLYSSRDLHRKMREVSVTERFENRKYLSRQMNESLQNIFRNENRLIYIPAGRSLLSTLSDQLLRTFDVKMDLMMQEFCQLIEDTKQRFGSRIPDMLKTYTQTVSGQVNNMALEEIYHLINRILKADYVSDSDGEKMYYDAHHFVRLQYASSGQHEALWILMLCYLIVLENRKSVLIVEEPEAHLFPEAQRWIVSLMVMTANVTGSKVMITTHSPYILTALNVLALSGQIEKKSNSDSIIPRLQRVFSGKMMAFRIKEGQASGNTLISIMDEETGLIEADYIDSVSTVINQEFDQLLTKENQEL